MKKALILLSILLFYFQLFSQEKEHTSVLITNVKVWDGTSDKVMSADVLIENNLIKEVKIV